MRSRYVQLTFWGRIDELTVCLRQGYGQGCNPKHTRVPILPHGSNIVNVVDWERPRLGQDADPNCRSLIIACRHHPSLIALDRTSQIPLGLDSPRKIAHHAFEEVFGVATIHTTPARVGDYEEVKGSLKLMDAHTLQRKCRANSALARSTLTYSITRTRCLRVRCRRGADLSPRAFV